MTSIRAAAAALMLGLVSAAHAQLVGEGFDNVAALGAAGWTQVDASTPAGAPWFQGNPGIFTSQAGAANAYVAVNPFTVQGAPLSVAKNYLETPVFSLAEPTRLTFYARSIGIAEGFPDHLQVRLSTAGSSTSAASFTSLLLDLATIVNAWTLQTINIAGVGAGATGRIAFVYDLPDALTAGSYLGIDTVRVIAVPEPSIVASMLAGLGAIGLALGRRRRSTART